MKIEKINGCNPSVTKYVYEFEEGTEKSAIAESVLYKYPTFEERTVICCSTQSGCPIGCRFCGAGDYFVRSLTSEEILAQVEHCFTDNDINVPNIKRLQIMFMSMGEPMLNPKVLKEALKELYVRYPNANLLISTSAPNVDFNWLNELSKKIPKIGLQFSIHESTDEKRNKLIPFENKLTLEQISTVGKKWKEECGRKPFYNYCVHEKNNTRQDAILLTELFPPHLFECTISVICERNEYIAASNPLQKKLAEDFMNMMVEIGNSVRMFDPESQDDIGGGCGQLWFVQNWMRNNPNRAKPSIGRDLPMVHTPRAA